MCVSVCVGLAAYKSINFATDKLIDNHRQSVGVVEGNHTGCPEVEHVCRT